MLTFQGLDTGFLIGAEDMNTALVQFWCCSIQLADRSDFVVKLLWVLTTLIVQPIAKLVRLEIGLALKNAPHDGLRYLLRCLV